VKVVQATQRVQSIGNDEIWRTSCLSLTAKLCELVVFKPTLERDLDAERALAWATELLKSYSYKACMLAIEQAKHSSESFVNFGTLATEARRISEQLNPSYRPFGDSKRLTVTQLQEAAFDGNEKAAERLKHEQHVKLLQFEKQNR